MRLDPTIKIVSPSDLVIQPFVRVVRVVMSQAFAQIAISVMDSFAFRSCKAAATALKPLQHNWCRTFRKDSGLPTKGSPQFWLQHESPRREQQPACLRRQEDGQNASCCRLCSSNNNSTVNGVLAQLVERLNGIEAFLSRKSLKANVTCLLCHKLLSQHTTGSWYDAA